MRGTRVRSRPWRWLAGLFLTGVAVATTLVVGSPANAAAAYTCPSRTGAHYTVLCFYWGGSGTGAYWNSGQELVNDLHPYVYPNNGTGGGQHVKNNAASARNMYGVPIYVYYNENRTGPMDTLNPYAKVNLYYTWNDEASYVVWCYFCS
jgi:hypothetical protein